jgi:hypothetical protein
MDRGEATNSLLQELMATPVGRRWVLKVGLGSVGAAVVGSALAGSAGAQGAPSSAGATAAAVATGTTTATTLQFALGADSDLRGLTLVANGTKVPLVAHTDASRAALEAQGALFAHMDLSALTHYVSAVPLPAGRALLLSVQGKRNGRHVAATQLLYVPSATTMALAQASRTLTGSYEAAVGSANELAVSTRLKALGISPGALDSPEAVAQLDSIADPSQAAVALTMCHPNVATVDATAAAATKSILGQTSEVQSLGTAISTLTQQGKDWATYVQVADADGSPSQIKVGDTTTTFTTFKLNTDDASFAQATKTALSAAVVAVRDAQSLGAVIDKPLEEVPSASSATWVQPQGVVATPQPYTTGLAASQLSVTVVQNPGVPSGTTTTVNGSYANGQVPLKLYNNFVRWVWVYVQYLGANNTNLSANPNAKFPDTKYAKSLGLLPQVFTILGAPLWNTNSIDVTLTFPEEAHAARILYCGLGCDLNDGGWRQYFPTDAYPGAVAPTDEVKIAAIITGVLTIAMNVFALVTDVDIAVLWGGIRKLIDSYEYFADIAECFTYVAGKTAAEATAATVVTGTATYEDLAANHDSTANLWEILLGLASVIPKIIFNPRAFGFWIYVGADILGQEGAARVANSLPFVGEVIAAIEAVGDIITLAEVAAETIISPWVIENQVTLTYPVRVTIQRDEAHHAATFPSSAVSWTLQATVDGGVALPPITAAVNVGGHTQSADIALDVAAPFGGQKIQWGVVFVDGSSNQVGTASAGPFVNNDPDHLTTAVTMEITELPEPISAATVFKRADTTTYDTSAGGYSWSNQVTDTATVSSTGDIQEVTGVSVATAAGVVALSWKQNDRYYLRGVPIVENGSTIKLGPATKQGYARTPFVLLDPLVGAGDLANHFVLEPDEHDDAYQVRKVTLDATTGALSWDPTISYGRFTLPVSAAALHSSGRIVAVHTDSGRLGFLQPVNTPLALAASYAAGPGNQVGLLHSPIALAITSAGVIVVLEAGPAELAAFDLNANPVPYFGPSSSPPYTMALPTATYLDVAVDGSDQIYLLSYAGDGSSPGDYRIDVYSPTGTPVATNSPGVNIARLAVDYWRSIYGANYDPLSDSGTTKAHVDVALGVAEPSVSRFDPATPPPPSSPTGP